ncbi:MAG: hypothetical protein IT238_04875 [Bacteroidia bacterium]|nr:hypothetical protein [Bacteroidia bacterium]MCZ2248371.1 hypothetical protein [Bacteroidia bacterium]
MTNIYLSNNHQKNNNVINGKELKPRPFVINNLLNYSKSLEVKHFQSGKTVAVILN